MKTQRDQETQKIHPNSVMFRSKLAVRWCSLLATVVLALAVAPYAGATITVTTLDDSGPGSLRQAIADATPGDSIDFAVTGTIVLTNGQLVIDKDLTIIGPGVANLTVSGNNASRAFYIGPGTVLLSELTIANGRTDNGGGVANVGGSLTISNSAIINNTASGTGGGLYSIWGNMVVLNTQISSNSASYGGGISSEDPIVIVDSTISANQASSTGAGAAMVRQQSVSMTNVTISGNSGAGWAGVLSIYGGNLVSSTIISNSGLGVAIASPGFTPGSLKVGSTIIAENSSGDYSGALDSLDFNLIGDTNGAAIMGVTMHNIYGQNPLLGPLADNGGPTPTHALLPGSPAIDHGSSGGLVTDQRGRPRPCNFASRLDADDGSDIGAYELQGRSVTTLDDSGPGSLRQAIADAAPGDTIDFAVTGIITLTSGELVIDKDLTISGPGATNLTISGNGANRVFDIGTNGVVTMPELRVLLSGLTMANGRAYDGGGIRNVGSLAIANCIISNATSGYGTDFGYGGGIANIGVLVMSNSTIVNCTSSTGGGLCDAVGAGDTSPDSRITIINSTFSGNSAYQGAAINDFGSPATILNSTFSGNYGGYAGAAILNQSSMMISNCTIFGNTSWHWGAGLGSGGYSGGTVTIRNSIVAGNSVGGESSDVESFDGIIISEDFNLIQNTNGATFSGITKHNIYGKAPLLGPLADNGGPTMTHALLPGSPAIDQGSSGGLTTDQCGQPRPVDFPDVANADGGDGSDIGAFELQDRPQGGPAFTVNTTDDMDNGLPGVLHCSLREAINAANANPGAHTINLAVTGTITLTNGELVITNDLTISGPGATNLTVSGNNASRVFRIDNGVVTISGMTIASGFTSGMGTSKNGGGIWNSSVLTVTNCLVASNLAGWVGGFDNGGGGGIGNAGTLTIASSEVSRNTGQLVGGGIWSTVGSVVLIANSTICSNNGGYWGGGIYGDNLNVVNSAVLRNRGGWYCGGIESAGGGMLTVSNSTISGNSAGWDGGGGGILSVNASTIACSTITANDGGGAGQGGGIYKGDGTAMLIVNSIVAGNMAATAPDCYTASGMTVSSGDYNLIQDTNGCSITGVIDHNIYGKDPLLGPLAYNGGPTMTHALLPGSPAIDHGSSGGLATDQRGQPRVFNFPAYFDAADGSDIGAYELQERAQTGPVFTVNTTDDVDDGVPGIAHCSLREAINAANASPGAHTINFATGVPELCNGVTGTITLTNGELTIPNSVNIIGPGAANLTVSGNNTSRVFNSSCAAVSISGLTIANGSVGSAGGEGGGIQSLGGSLLLNDCIVSNCAANSVGGIFCVEANNCGFYFDMRRCTITSNEGGGVFVWGRFSASDSTICSNTGGGLATVIFVGGLTNCTISGNGGDGVYWGTAAAPGYEVSVASCTICSNAWVGIRNSGWPWGTVTVYNTIVSGNSGGTGPDCSGGVNSGDFNLIQNTNGVVITGASSHNIYDQDPNLGPLADLGGPTPTHALRFDSPAIDAGNSGGLTTDQRGSPRTIDDPNIANAEGGDITDIGAFEADPRLRIADIRLAGQDAWLGFNSMFGRSYRLECAENLGGPWSILAIGVTGSGGRLQIIDPGARTLPRRFYRAALDDSLFGANFEAGSADGWTAFDSSLVVTNGALELKSNAWGNDARAVAGDIAWSNYCYEVDFIIADNPEGSSWPGSILFHIAEIASGLDAGKYYQVSLGPNRVGIERINNSGGAAQWLAVTYNVTIPIQIWHHLRLVLQGDQATVWIDGALALRCSGLNAYPTGGVGLKAINEGTMLFDNAKVWGL